MSLHFCLLHQIHQAAMNHVSLTVFENPQKIASKIRETLFTFMLLSAKFISFLTSFLRRVILHWNETLSNGFSHNMWSASEYCEDFFPLLTPPPIFFANCWLSTFFCNSSFWGLFLSQVREWTTIQGMSEWWCESEQNPRSLWSWPKECAHQLSRIRTLKFNKTLFNTWSHKPEHN